MLSKSVLSLLRGWLPVAYLIPLAYIFQPVLFEPLDARLYNFFASKRDVPPWTEVVTVGIDQKTIQDVFRAPIYPLSRHVQEHATLVDNLAEAGARAIVFDLQLSAELFDNEPIALARAFRSTGRIYLVLTLVEEQKSGQGNEVLKILRAVAPDSSLLNASKGAYVTSVHVDPDGVLRRFKPDPGIQILGLETLPEVLSGIRLKRSMPIEFPSVDRPMPTISYRDALIGNEDALSGARGKIAFVGSILEESSDYISVPRLQILNGGRKAFQMPGVTALAAITENMIKGPAVRDARWPIVLLWSIFWCILLITAMQRKRPASSILIFIGVFIAALISTGVLHIEADLILPGGLLAGCLLACRIHTMVVAHIGTVKSLAKEEAEIGRVKKEMETARLTQLRFLPKEIPAIEGYDVWATNISSLEVSGDYYDVIHLKDSKSLAIAIADVSGKGLPASLLMSNVQAGLHSQIFQHRFDVAETANNLNRLVYENTSEEIFVTLFLSELSIETNILKYIRAGHEMPFIISKNGSVKFLEDGGMVLGLAPDIPYKCGETVLREGDVLCLYTDGITEARNDSDEEYGLDRLKDIVRANHTCSAEEIGAAILNDVYAFSRLSKQADDITLVVVHT